MEIVTKDGDIYQIGKLYADKDGSTGRLEGVHSKYNKFILISGHERWEANELTKIDASDLGAIEKAPIELEDGKPYSFNVDGGIFLGFYNKDRKSFMNGGGKICGSYEAGSIKLLMVDGGQDVIR